MKTIEVELWFDLIFLYAHVTLFQIGKAAKILLPAALFVMRK